MRVTLKGQEPLLLRIRRALGFGRATRDGLERDELADPSIDAENSARQISRMRGAGTGEMTTEQILALTRR